MRRLRPDALCLTTEPVGQPCISPDAGVGRNPMLSALAAQILGALLAGLLAVLLAPRLLALPLALAALQGACAVLASWRLGEPAWRLPIHALFMPLAVLVHGLDLPAWLWPAGLVMLLLVFWRTDRSQVPLFLSNRLCRKAVLDLLPASPCRVLDLGCGDGALLRQLARARPDCRFVGIEHAPLPWCWAWLSASNVGNLEIRFGDFWNHSLAGYAVVHAFLSPAAMPRLATKADDEMAPGARLVSNSFPFPDRQPDAVVDVTDRRHTRLHVYELQGARRS
ncbi:MAG: methyltransferase type 12 [Rhodocyclales bacterium]|nr:methyltransferase type 12 [Rhodocyclales bacterium]